MVRESLVEIKGRRIFSTLKRSFLRTGSTGKCRTRQGVLLVRDRSKGGLKGQLLSGKKADGNVRRF